MNDAELEAAQIQRIAVRDYKTHRGRHFVLTIRGPADGARARAARRSEAAQPDAQAAAARRWLAAAADMVRVFSPSEEDRDAKSKAAEAGINIGLTYRGLQRLELARRYLAVFEDKAPAFVEGAFLRAARRLGDSGDSDAEHWKPLFGPDAAHLLLLLHADEESELEEMERRLRALDAEEVLTGWEHRFDAQHFGTARDNRRVHFGLRDGITRIVIEGVRAPDDALPGERHEPGEFLLGHTNDTKFNPWALTTAPDEVTEFFRNGSFCVFRQIEQDVAGFEKFVQDCARAEDVTPEYVVAKLVGRWPDGQPIDAASPSDPPAALASGAVLSDEFDFTQDAQGIGCPFGAHIRRMNPRGDPVIPSRPRPLIRRGMPYGPEAGKEALPQAAGSKAKPSTERGLMGLFFCASIEDQFEHLVAEWGNKNPMGMDNRGDARDPLIGSHGSAPSVFDIPMGAQASSRKLLGFKPFTITRGTVYAFFPTRHSLRTIACDHHGTHEAVRDDCPICRAARDARARAWWEIGSGAQDTAGP